MTTGNDQNVADQELVGSRFDPDAQRESEKKLKDLKRANLGSVFGGGMGRLSLVFVGIGFAVIFSIGAYKIFGKKAIVAPPPSAKEAMISAPSAQGADSFAATDQEAEMRRLRNQQQAAEAKATGAAYIAPPVLKPEPVVSETVKAPEGPKGTPEDQRRQLQAAQQPANIPDPSGAAAQQRRDQQMAETMKLRDALKKDDIMPQIMVASGLGWKGESIKPFSTSYYTLPDRAKAQQAQAAATTAVAGTTTAGASAPSKPLIYSAGEACYGTIDYCINTDNPGNQVIASIPLCKGQKDLKVIGKYDFKEQAQAIAINFDKLTIPGRQAVSIQAMAIDEDTMGTGIVDEVDNHLLRRFGATALAAFITGMGKAAQLPVGTTSTTSTGLSSQSTTVQEPMTTARQTKIAMGEAGQSVGDQLKRQNEAIRATVKVCRQKDGKNVGNRAIGVVFLADVY